MRRADGSEWGPWRDVVSEDKGNTTVRMLSTAMKKQRRRPGIPNRRKSGSVAQAGLSQCQTFIRDPYIPPDSPTPPPEPSRVGIVPTRSSLRVSTPSLLPGHENQGEHPRAYQTRLRESLKPEMLSDDFYQRVEPVQPRASETRQVDSLDIEAKPSTPSESDPPEAEKAKKKTHRGKRNRGTIFENQFNRAKKRLNPPPPGPPFPVTAPNQAERSKPITTASVTSEFDREVAVTDFPRLGLAAHCRGQGK